MSQWTDAARMELERYFTRVRPSIVTGGADADEVIEDLRRHLDSEIQSAKLTVVTEQDVRRLLARIGAPQPGNDSPTNPPPPNTSPPTPVLPPPKAGFALLLFGVLLPAFTLGFELVTGACASAFFDPTPSLWHMLLVAFVPVANVLTWFALRRGDAKWRTRLGWANGIAIGVAIYYSILYAPLMLPGVVGVIFFGFGLLPLTPAISLVATLVFRKKLRQLGGAAALPGFWRGVAVAGLALLTLAAPSLITKIAMQKAVSNEPEEQLSGIQWLRAVGSEETLLRACYGFTAGAANADLTTWLIDGDRRPSAEQAREIYFRVTGRPFNTVSAPTVRTGRGVWNDLNDWTWDEDQGGEKVGGRIKGLFLHSSRMDTTINGDAAWSYTEWTMEFRNDSTQQREARAQILLPPGGVVSRLTLWVNGEEREAAFAGRAQTRQAYQKVAIQQRRDPVLVATAGPDRVLMQCFPVQPNGGIMKVRIGITAPLSLESAASAMSRLPLFLERNFTVRKSLTHFVWAQGTPGLTSACKQLASEPSNDGMIALRGQINDAQLASPEALLKIARDPNHSYAWTKDIRSPGDHFIRQVIQEDTSPMPAKIVFVVDGSAGMQPYWQSIAETLDKLPATAKSTILVASDHVETFDTAGALKSLKPVGGQDNLPALIRAWNLSVQEPGSVVVWIHGPQPLQLESEQALLQAVERTAVPPRIYEIQTEPGPDQIIARLDGVPSLRSVLRSGSLSQDIANLVARLEGTTKSLKIRREQLGSEAEAQAGGAIEGSPHLARLWANDAIARLKSQRKINEATKLASLYQLVTPVSGAVVLETEQQYAQNGLTPTDPQSVPAIPEPGTWALLALGAAALWFARGRRGSLKSSP
jgi:hypothetical protein